MLQLKSSDLKALILPQTAVAKKADSAGSGMFPSLAVRSAGRVFLSTGLGAGLVYIGVKKKGAWHIATFLGALNLLGNGTDIVDRIT